MVDVESPSDMLFCLDLLKYHEIALFNKLVVDTKTHLKRGLSSYEVLMRETSDVM